MNYELAGCRMDVSSQEKSGIAGASPQTFEGSSDAAILKQILRDFKEVTRWYSLGIQLSIDTSYLDQIEKNYGGDAERCRIEVIKFWLRNVQKFTWKKLAQAVKGVGGHAKVVQTLMANHKGCKSIPLQGGSIKRSAKKRKRIQSESSDLSDSSSGFPSSEQSSSHEGTTQIYDHISCKALVAQCAGGKTLSFSYTKNTQNARMTIQSSGYSSPSEEQPDTPTTPASENSHNVAIGGGVLLPIQNDMGFNGDIERAFARLLLHTCRSFKKKELSMNEIVLYLKPMSLFSSSMEEVHKAENMEKLFEVFADKCSWYNHSLLKDLINDLGDDQDEERFQEYHKTFTLFLKSTLPKIQDEYSFGTGCGEGQKLLSIKINENWDKTTLEQVSQIHHSIARILLVQLRDLYLASVSKGCICLEFLVPESMAMLLCASQKQTLMAVGVFRLECGEYVWQDPNYLGHADRSEEEDNGYEGCSEGESDVDLTSHPQAGKHTRKKGSARRTDGRGVKSSSKLPNLTESMLSEGLPEGPDVVAGTVQLHSSEENEGHEQELQIVVTKEDEQLKKGGSTREVQDVVFLDHDHSTSSTADEHSAEAEGLPEGPDVSAGTKQLHSLEEHATELSLKNMIAEEDDQQMKETNSDHTRAVLNCDHPASSGSTADPVKNSAEASQMSLCTGQSIKQGMEFGQLLHLPHESDGLVAGSVHPFHQVKLSFSRIEGHTMAGKTGPGPEEVAPVGSGLGHIMADKTGPGPGESASLESRPRQRMAGLGFGPVPEVSSEHHLHESLVTRKEEMKPLLSKHHGYCSPLMHHGADSTITDCRSYSFLNAIHEGHKITTTGQLPLFRKLRIDMQDLPQSVNPEAAKQAPARAESKRRSSQSTPASLTIKIAHPLAFRQLVYNFLQRLSREECRAIVYIRLYEYCEQYRDASALDVLSKLEMCGAFSPGNPAGLIDVAKDINRSDLVNMVNDFMKIEKMKAKTNKGSTLVNTNESSDEEMVQLQSTMEMTLSQALILAQQVDILQRAIVSRDRQTATDASRDTMIAAIALSECLTKVHNLPSAQSSTRSCSSGEDSYSKTGPGPGELAPSWSKLGQRMTLLDFGPVLEESSEEKCADFPNRLSLTLEPESIYCHKMVGNDCGGVRVNHAFQKTFFKRLFERLFERLCTPLHLAAERGHVDIVNFLCKKGANIHSEDNDGNTPLDMAAGSSREDVVSYLKRAAVRNMLEESESTGREQEQKKSPKETDNSSEESSATAVNEEETKESDHEEIDSQVESLLEKYRHQPKIKHKSLKCLFTGLPRAGTTVLKKRLLRVIKNLITSGVLSPSGGLEKPMTVVIGETRECVTVVMESDIDWKPQRNLLDETQIVLKFINQHPTTPHLAPPTPALVPPIPDRTQVSPELVLPTPVPPTPIPSTPLPPKPVPSTLTPPKPDPPGVAKVDEVRQLIQEVLSSGELRSIRDIEKTTTIYLMDTGGQPEFHKIMPIILNGPALYLVFFNLAFNLDDHIHIRFCQQGGSESLITYDSSYIGKRMIFQLLSSPYYLSKGLSRDNKPTAVLIATHLDQLMNQEGQRIIKVEEVNDPLKELFRNMEFHDQAFLTHPKEDEKSTIFIPINNHSGDKEEIKQLQIFIRQVIDDRFSSVQLPSSCLFFHLLLHHHYENSPGVCKLEDCQALARGCGLDENNVPQVLLYIHRSLGTILFYEDVPGLNELVVCDPNVLFRSISQLVAVSFGGGRTHHTLAAEIRKTGEIPERVLERIGTQPSNSLLTNEDIIKVLQHFKILTELPSDDGMVYFMPCLLQPDYSPELSCEALEALCPPPLLVRFDCNYIPVGVFSALVVNLTRSSWELDQDSRYRNHILFHTDDAFPVDGLSSVELIVYPAYLEFHSTITSYKEQEPEEIHKFCMKVRKTVVYTLRSILGLHEHTKKAKFQLGFYCPGSFHSGGQLHFCGCLPRQNHTNDKMIECSKSPHCQDKCCLPHECTIWFDYWKIKETTKERSHAYDGNAPTKGLCYEPKMADLLNEIPVKLPDKWQDISRGLGLEEYELRQIQVQHGWQQSTNVLFSSVFEKWHSGKQSPYTWEQVLKVLYQPAVGGNRVADELKKKYRVN